jgi:hypothetical protein
MYCVILFLNLYEVTTILKGEFGLVGRENFYVDSLHSLGADAVMITFVGVFVDTN